MDMSAVTTQPSQKARMVWLDALRVFAGLCIVAVHSSSDAAGQAFPNFEESERIIPVLFRSIVYIARTELFLIISLFLLMMSVDRKPRSYGNVIADQARRLLVPFAFWVMFYAFYRLIKANYFGYAHAIIDQYDEVESWIGYFLLGDVNYHMHFLPTLFGMILMFPAYKLAIRYPQIALLVVVCLVAKLYADRWMWGNVRGEWYFDYLLRFTKIITYGGYGLIAASLYGLLKRDFDRETGFQILAVGLLAGVVFFIFKLLHAHQIITSGTWAHSYAPGYYADMLAPAILFLCILATRHCEWPALFSKIAPYTFGVYLVHPSVMDLVEIFLTPYNLGPTAFVGSKFLLTFSGTLAVVMAISKFGPMAWTIGLGPQPFGALFAKIMSGRKAMPAE